MFYYKHFVPLFVPLFSRFSSSPKITRLLLGYEQIRAKQAVLVVALKAKLVYNRF